jgi:hypothetical protein
LVILIIWKSFGMAIFYKFRDSSLIWGLCLAASLLGVAFGEGAIAQESPGADHLHTPYEHFYIGIDNLPTLVRGNYVGLSNPNYGRLTWLTAHLSETPSTNHFHGIGSYSYAGPVGSPEIVFGNARVPETYTLQPPLKLNSGSGLYANRLVSQAGDAEYSNLLTKPLASLMSYQGDAEHSEGASALFNSSAGRWNSTLSNTQIGIKLLSKTDGLSIGDRDTLDLFAAGDTVALGTGDDFSFLPVFSTEKGKPSQDYSATFQLVNFGGGSALASGQFSVDVTSVPEPGSVVAFVAMGLVGFGLRRKSSALTL